MRSSVAIPHGAAARPRLPYSRMIAVIAAQLALVAALGWFCLPQSVGGRADWVMVSGTSMLPQLHTGDLVLFERQSGFRRLLPALARLIRNRTLVLAAANIGLLATFVGMVASGRSGPIGTVMFVPWVALLATELGPALGGLAGVAATGLYLA